MSEKKSQYKYSCNICDYGTSNKKDYTKHLTTRKHINRTGLNDKSPNIVPTNHFGCDVCGRSFKARNSLWYHKKKCVETEPQEETTIEPSGVINTNVVMTLLTQNQEFKELMLEQSKQLLEQQEENKILQNKLLEAVKEGKTINNTTNNTTNNNKFNLNFFLNEQCKDAMNISEFIDNMVLSVEDLKNTGRLGYIDGITKIFTDKLKEMDTCNRPMHCTDLKRETLYIKNNNEWDKDSNKDKMKTAIECVANKNLNNLDNWKDANPNHVVMDSTEDKEFVEIMTNSLGGMGSDREKNKQKIIKNVLKEVVVDK